jgi:dihydroxy-acid dehydratase
VRDGDIIRVDVAARTIDLDVDEDVLAERRAALPP